MELLNFSFVLLILKITVCVLPGVFGIFLIVSSKETKRRMRNKVCSRLFGVNNVIPSRKFAFFLSLSGTLMLSFSAAAIWFLVSGILMG